MVKTWVNKDPDEVLDYTYDWTSDLAPTENLVSQEFLVVNAAGITVDDTQLGTKAITVILSGGVDGGIANFISRVTTSQDRVFEDSIVLPIASTVAPQPHPGDYTPPTPANMVFEFPEFGEVSAGRIQSALKRAAAIVDEGWVESDFGFSRMLLAAHFLTESGLGSSAEAKAFTSGTGGFKVMSSGSLRLERYEETKDVDSGRFGTTTYGKRFKRLLRANRGGPRVTGAISGSWGDGDMSQRGPWS